MSQANANRHLLFGILALQTDFITRDQLVSALQTWAFQKTIPLGEILYNQGALAAETRSLLESLVIKHLAQHGNNPELSLASIHSGSSIREQLQQVADPEVQASLSQLASERTEQGDPFATYAPGSPSNVAPDQTAREDSFATQASTFPSNAASDQTAREDPFATQAPTLSSNAASGRTAHGERSGNRRSTAGTSTSSGIRFRILRPHARGGLGEVLVARDEELHREVALKQIQDRHADNAESQGRFLLEAEITGGLEHPGIVPVYGLGQYADGRPYYAMRFIRGDSLKDALEKFHEADVPGRDPGERSLELRGLLGRFVDVCDAIAYAHSRGVLHRDLKPGNIMLGKYGETLVVDWGLAKTVDSPVREATEVGEGHLTLHSGSLASQTVMGATVGTPQFMSPEQAAGRLDQMGPASDVYSLGATLYCVLTGRPPYIAPDVGEVLQKVKRNDFPGPRAIKPNIPPALEAICLKAMSHEPSNRYPTPRALADDIEHWLADEPVSAWKEPWSVRVRRWMGRHRTLVAGLLTAVLVASLALGAATVLLTAANERERAARALAQEKEKEAREQRDEARKQKDLAEHNYRLARRAVDRYHTEVSESVLLHEPGMQPLRKKLLEAAREFYEQFVREHATDSGVHGEMAHAFFRLAQITGDIASERKAIDLHHEARSIYASLLAEKPTDRELQGDLATSLHHLGRLYRRTNQFALAEQHYKDALTHWDALVTPPSDLRSLAGQARSQLGLGNVYEMTSKLEEARAIYQAALATREKLASNHPEMIELERDLAVSQHNLALVLSALGQNQKAETYYGGALKIQKRLAQGHPHISQYQNDLARTHYNLGDLHVQSGSSARAETPFKEAERLWQELTRLHPEVLDFQMNRADALVALANVFSDLRETAKAEEAVQKAIVIKQKLADEHKDAPQFRGDLARAYFQLGNVRRTGNKVALAEADYRQAEEIFQQLVDTHPQVPQFQNDLARCANNRGLLHDERAEKDQAEKAFLRALEVWQKLQAAHTQDREFSLGVNTAACNLGNMLAKNHDGEGALEWYRKALSALPPNDRSASVRDAFRNTYWKRAEVLTQLARHANALDDWNRAVDFANDSQRPWFQLYRARALARTGEHARAAEESRILAASASKSGEASFQLACAYALCSAAAAKDAALSMEERRTLSERHVVGTMQLLAQALSLGYFKTVANYEKLTKEMDLESLRTRPEFRRFLSEIEAPKAPETKP